MNDDSERIESIADPVDQEGEVAEMAEPVAATSNGYEDEEQPLAALPHINNSGKSGPTSKSDFLLSDDSHKSNRSSGGHRSRGEPSSSSSVGSRYSGDKFMTLEDLDKGHSPKPPPTQTARGGKRGELDEDEEEPADLSYELWATGDQVHIKETLHFDVGGREAGGPFERN